MVSRTRIAAEISHLRRPRRRRWVVLWPAAAASDRMREHWNSALAGQPFFPGFTGVSHFTWSADKEFGSPWKKWSSLIPRNLVEVPWRPRYSRWKETRISWSRIRKSDTRSHARYCYHFHYRQSRIIKLFHTRHDQSHCGARARRCKGRVAREKSVPHAMSSRRRL